MESTLAEDQISISRRDVRHSHIGIRLQYRVHDKWEQAEALGWNAVGFNFYHAHALQAPSLELRRGLTRFTGTVAWHSVNTSDDVVLATVVNRLLYARLLKLLRVPNMVAEKMKILATLGLPISDTKMAELVAQQKREHPMYHYGVKVRSDDWGAIVERALSVSSVLVSLDKWSGALGK